MGIFSGFFAIMIGVFTVLLSRLFQEKLKNKQPNLNQVNILLVALFLMLQPTLNQRKVTPSDFV